jgi:hypothetical protein
MQVHCKIEEHCLRADQALRSKRARLDGHVRSLYQKHNSFDSVLIEVMDFSAFESAFRNGTERCESIRQRNRINVDSVSQLR